MNAHRSEAIALMKKFYDLGGVSISQASMEKEFDTRPTFDLAGQLKIMKGGETSDVDKWMNQIAEFMKSTGTLPEPPQASRYGTDEYMRMVDSYPKLKEVANRRDRRLSAHAARLPRRHAA